MPAEWNGHQAKGSKTT